MTHLLPGSGVPWVHRARSPVPPRLPHFATPQSVPHLAAVAAGAYQPRYPPNAWSPGVPAPPGPCYWLVASRTPVGWRGGYLALGPVRGAVHHYCLGGCSALVVCAQRLRPVRGGWGRCRVLCLPRFPLPAPRFLRCVWGAVPSGCPLSSLAGMPFHAVCAFRGLGPVALVVFPACPLCWCALALSRRPRPPPLPGLVWRAHLARPRCWTLVGPFRAVRAPPRVLPWSRAPFGLLRGGGGRPGPVSPYLAWGCALPVGWVRAWGPVTNPTARALASWLCTLWGRHEGAQGGRHLSGCGASGVERSPTPDHSSFRALGRGPLPTGCGCGVCGRGDPSPTPQRAVLQACFARCGGGTTAPRGGRLLPGCGASGVGHSPTPDLSSFGACVRGPLPTGCGCRGCGRGASSPTPQRALLRAGFARGGGGMRVPGGGRLLPGRPGSGALPPPTARPLGRASGAHYPLAVGAGSAGVGTGHQPHRARSCVLAWRTVGDARGRPRGAPLAWVRGVRGWALSHPRPPVLSGVRPGPTTHWLWVRGVRSWGPVTNPTARAPASWLCALWGRHEGARGGRLLPGCGASGVGRSHTPDDSAFQACGRGQLPTGCGCGGCGRGDPSPTPQRALLRAGFARCGGGMRVPGGGASCLGVGRPGWGALPPPTTRPFDRAAGAHYPLAVGAGGAGLGTRHQPHSARSCMLALRAVGAARGFPGGAPLAWVWGVRGRAFSHP